MYLASVLEHVALDIVCLTVCPHFKSLGIFRQIEYILGEVQRVNPMLCERMTSLHQSEGVEAGLRVPA